MRKIFGHIIFYFFLGFSLQGQDLHYSQFYNSPININPALTGVFNGDKRVNLSARDQWRSVPVPWLTFSGSYDQKFYNRKKRDRFFSAGILFNYDRQGDSRIALTNLNLSGSFTYLFNKTHILTVGAMGGYASRGFNQSTLTWDKQWNGDVFDPSLPPGENIATDMLSMLETAVGVNYRLQDHERQYLDFGIGLYHILEPSTDFTVSGFNADLPRRYSFSGMGTFMISDNMDLQLSALYQRQISYQEFLFGGLVNLYINKKKGQETNLHLGLGYRTSQSLYPKIAIEYKSYYVGFSYDVDLSRFNIATDYKGGPEIHFKYTIKSVKPLGVFKACPIF